MAPRLTHFAINTDDVEATQAFYAEVFGWSFRAYGPPGFVQVMDESGEQPMGDTPDYDPAAAPSEPTEYPFRGVINRWTDS